MKKRIFFKLFLAVLPILFIGIFYVIADPFLCLFSYKDYNNVNHRHLTYNEDFVHTNEFIALNPANKFDSYVFGNSRTRYFTREIWASHINSSNIFSYGVALETLFGEVNKLKFIKRQGNHIKNAIVSLDFEILSVTTNSKGHLYKKHPLISGESMLDFQFTSFMDFINYTAIKSYLESKQPSTATTAAKEDKQQEYERMILSDSNKYYDERKKIFYERSPQQTYYPPVIGNEQKKLLTEMRDIFVNDKTNFKIVIPPLYDQKKLAAIDIKYLVDLFGKDHIYDFSGINEITSSKYNYFETSHFRPTIAKRIIDSIYHSAAL